MAENDLTGTKGQTSDPISKPHSVEEMVPSSTPLIIPYFEVYRTNELEYVEYVSPYTSQGGEESGSESEGSDGSGSDSGLTDEQKKKREKLKSALSELLDKYYPSLTNKDKYIEELINDEVGWTSVARTVNKMGNPKSRNQNYIIEQVLQLKEQYAGVTRRTYAQTKKTLEVAGKALNTKKGQKIIAGLSNSKIWDGTNKRYVDDVVANKLGSTLKTISENYK